MSFIFGYTIATIVICLIILIYRLIQKRLEYFSTRGIPYIKPTFQNIFKSSSVIGSMNLQIEIFEREKDKGNPCIGIFQKYLQPSIIVLDPALVESVLIKDFSHFHDHGIDIDTVTEPLAGHLFNMKGDQWRTLRNKLLPTFSSGKLKGMIPTMVECSYKLIRSMKKDNKMLKNVNLKDLSRNYSLSVIASCVFGVDPDSIKDPNCEFRKILNEVLNPTHKPSIKRALITMVPELTKLLKIKLYPKHVDSFYINLTKDALEARKNSGIKRNDFVQLLLELKEKGYVQMNVRDLEEDEKKNDQQRVIPETNFKLVMTDELLAAQAFVFIVGGYDITAYLAAITTYLLSKHKDIQQSVRKEVREALSKHGGMNYLALKDMKLLEASLNESLRMHSAAVILMRKCNKNYSLSNGITIEKGMRVMIPTKAFQMDSRFWPNPERFDPGRFTDTDITPGTFLPFGDGPRICIAQRLALLMIKILLGEMIVNFELMPSNKTKEPLKQIFFGNADFEGGLWGSFDPLQEEIKISADKM